VKRDIATRAVAGLLRGFIVGEFWKWTPLVGLDWRLSLLQFIPETVYYCLGAILILVA
jgi:hypothetical protein